MAFTLHSLLLIWIDGRANEYLQFFHLNVKLDYSGKCSAFEQRLTFASLTDVDSQTGQQNIQCRLYRTTSVKNRTSNTERNCIDSWQPTKNLQKKKWIFYSSKTIKMIAYVVSTPRGIKCSNQICMLALNF